MEDFNAIVARFFSVPSGSVSDGLSAKDIPDWDSMNYLLLIAEVEKVYDVSFTMDEVLSAKTLGDIKKYLVARNKSI